MLLTNWRDERITNIWAHLSCFQSNIYDDDDDDDDVAAAIAKTPHKSTLTLSKLNRQKILYYEHSEIELKSNSLFRSFAVSL